MRVILETASWKSLWMNWSKSVLRRDLIDAIITENIIECLLYVEYVFYNSQLGRPIYIYILTKRRWGCMHGNQSCMKGAERLFSKNHLNLTVGHHVFDLWCYVCRTYVQSLENKVYLYTRSFKLQLMLNENFGVRLK